MRSTGERPDRKSVGVNYFVYFIAFFIRIGDLFYDFSVKDITSYSACFFSLILLTKLLQYIPCFFHYLFFKRRRKQ